MGDAFQQLLEVARLGGRRFDGAVASEAPPVAEPAAGSSNPPMAAASNQQEAPKAATSSPQARRQAPPSSSQAAHAPNTVPEPSGVAASSIATEKKAPANASSPPAARDEPPPKGLNALSALFEKVDWRQFDADQNAIRADPAELARMPAARRQNLEAGNAALQAYLANKERLSAQLQGIKKDFLPTRMATRSACCDV